MEHSRVINHHLLAEEILRSAVENIQQKFLVLVRAGIDPGCAYAELQHALYQVTVFADDFVDGQDINSHLETVTDAGHAMTKKLVFSGVLTAPVRVAVEVPDDITDTERQWLDENLSYADVEWEWQDHDVDVDDVFVATNADVASHRLVREEDGELRIENV